MMALIIISIIISSYVGVAVVIGLIIKIFDLDLDKYDLDADVICIFWPLALFAVIIFSPVLLIEWILDKLDI